MLFAYVKPSSIYPNIIYIKRGARRNCPQGKLNTGDALGNIQF